MFDLRKAPSLVLAALVAVTVPIVPALKTQAQTPDQSDLSLPQSVAAGTKVWIDGDPSLKPTTESLSRSFEEQFPGTNINYESQGSDPAVIGVISGRLDVAAIGRDLTSLEERAGVETLSLSREKIATFVGVDNSFRGEISDQQFAQIFRGEITNWSELGGENIPIRFIDLAATSDTRRSLGSYALFQDAPFESGDTAFIQPNNITSVIESLGNDGIGYALYEQVKDRPDIRIVPMHGVMPTDVRYPFSQPRNFAYLEANPTPEAIAFLGYVNGTAPTAIQSHSAGPDDWNLGRNAKALDKHLTLQPPSSTPDTVVDSTSGLGAGQVNSTNTVRNGLGIAAPIYAPWWWLVPLAPLGVIGLAAMRRRHLQEAKAAEIGTTTASDGLPQTGLSGLVAAGAGLTGVGLAARGLRGRSAAHWGSNSLANGTIANDDAASFALDRPQEQKLHYQTPHHQTVNELDLAQSAQAPQGPAKTDLETANQRPSLQLNPSLEQPIHNRFDGKIVSPQEGLKGVTQSAADPQNLTFPTPNQATESSPGLGAVAGAGLAGAGLAAASSSTKDSAPLTWAALALDGQSSLAIDPPEQISDQNKTGSHDGHSLPGEIGDRPTHDESTPTPNNIRHLSERRRRELVDHSIDKALERPNGGKKNMPPQDQPSQELLYDNPKPGATETAANGEPVEPLSFENPATSRNQNKLSAEDSTALGNALKRAGLGTAGMAGAARVFNHQTARENAEQAPRIEVAATSEVTPTGPSSRLDAPMAGLGNSENEQTWITLTPLNSHQGEVNWHISEEHRLEAKCQGGQRMMIRIHDADPSTQTEPWLISSYTYECRSSMDRKQVDLPVPDRDYVAEIGFISAEEDWIHIARSFHSHSPTAEYDGCRIVIMPCDPHRQMRSGPTRNPKPQAYVYWDIAPEFKRRLRKQGGQMLALRIYDADHINLDQQRPHHTDEYMLDENARDKVVTVPTAEHDYVAEIGYLKIDGEFLSLGRSVFAHIPVAVSQR